MRMLHRLGISLEVLDEGFTWDWFDKHYYKVVDDQSEV